MISAPASRRLAAAALAGLATALVAHLATLFVFFVGNQLTATVIPVANGFFGYSVVVAFVVITVAAYLTELSRWYYTLLAGLAGAVIGAFLGTYLGAALSGTPLSPSLAGTVLESLLGVNLVLVIAVVVSTLAVAPRVYERVVSSRPAKLRSGKVALVRLPAANLEEGAVTHIERTPVDSEAADGQWAGYVDAFRAEGWRIVEVAPADDLADSVFVEDAIIAVGDLAILTRPGAEHRRDEVLEVEKTVRQLGMSVARISEPGLLDGGDVLQVGDTVYVGVGGRTNAEAVRQLRELVAGTGRSVVAVPVRGALHLKSAVTALPDGTVLGHADHVDPRLFARYLEVPEPSGAHVVALADDTVLLAASAPETASLIESLGYRVVRVDISEFEKLEGCVTCLSVRLR